MRQGRDWAGAGAFAVILMLAAAAARAQSCDEHDPASPAATAHVTLGPGDYAGEGRNELRSFVVTGSLGAVTAKVAASTPSGIVQSLSATPETSQLTPHFGEQLKGIDIRVTLKRHDRAVSVSVALRQVCAQYFRNTFLY